MPHEITRFRARLLAGWCLVLLSAGLVAPPVSAVGASATPADSLHWRTCEGSILRGAECATLIAPLDWAAPGPDKVRLAVARMRATGPSRDRIGVLMFNPGGPGASGLQALTTVAERLPAVVRARFDLVTWDPRGVGASTPRLAECAAARPSPTPPTGPVDWVALATSVHVERAAAMGPCLSANAAAASYLGTWFGVRDLDAIRRALGEQRITFWGMSYGSTIGRAYAQEFPGRLRALVLDGAVDPLSTTPSYAREQISAAATGWDRMAASLGPRTRARYLRVMRALDERAITDPQGRTITRWDIAASLLDAIPNQAAWSDFGYLLRGAAFALFSTDPDLRSRSAELLADAFEGTGTSTLDPVLAMVDCTDLRGRLTADESADITVQAAATGGIVTGLAAMDRAATCAGVPADLGRPLHPDTAIALRTPPIIVNAIADPRTPWSGARTAANVFTGAVMVTYDSAEHLSWTRTESRCVNDAVTEYVLTARLPAGDIACPFARAVGY